MKMKSFWIVPLILLKAQTSFAACSPSVSPPPGGGNVYEAGTTATASSNCQENDPQYPDLNWQWFYGAEGSAEKASSFTLNLNQTGGRNAHFVSSWLSGDGTRASGTTFLPINVGVKANIAPQSSGDCSQHGENYGVTARYISVEPNISQPTSAFGLPALSFPTISVISAPNGANENGTPFFDDAHNKLFTYKAGTYTVRFTPVNRYSSENSPFDYAGNSQEITFTCANLPPKVTVLNFQNGQNPTAGSPITLYVQTEEPDSDPITKFKVDVLERPTNSNFTGFETAGSGPVGNFSITPDINGPFKLLISASDATSGFGAGKEFSFDVGAPEVSLSILREDTKVAQSIFLENPPANSSEKIDLIEAKPVTFRARIRSLNQIVPTDSRIVGIKATISAAGKPDINFAGCSTFSKIAQVIDEGDQVADDNTSAYVNLFQVSGEQSKVEVGNGQIRVEVNPNEQLDGFPAGSECGTSVGHLSESNNQDNSANYNFVGKPTPDILLSYWKVEPKCLNGICEHNSVNNLENFANFESETVKNMYPVAPSHVRIAAGSNQAIYGYGPLNTFIQKLIGEACPIAEYGPVCFWDSATIIDLQNIRRAGTEKAIKENVTLTENSRFIGVVPSSTQTGWGYFKYLGTLLNYRKDRSPRGVHQIDVPNAMLAAEGEKMTVPHELGHSFGLHFENNHYTTISGQADNFHESVNTVAQNGYWNNDGIREFLTQKRSFMVGGGVFDNGVPPSTFWINKQTYSDIYLAMTRNNRSKIKAFDGEQTMISGIVNEAGNFFLTGTDMGLRPGITYGDGEGHATMKVRDPLGKLQGTTTVPLNYKLIAEDDGIEDTVSPIAGVSTGVPFSTGALSVSVSTNTKASFQSIEKTYFPAIEIIRSGINRLQDAAFKNNKEDALNSFETILGTAEKYLSEGDLLGARNQIAGSLKVQFLKSINGNLNKRSFFEFDLSDILNAATVSTGSISRLITSFPSTQNGFIRVMSEKKSLTLGQKGFFSIFSVRQPDNAAYQYDISAFANENEQRVKWNGKNWIVETSSLPLGSNNIVFHSYLEPKNEGDLIRNSIYEIQKAIYSLSRELEQETDPEKRNELRLQIEDKNRHIVKLRHQLASIRTEVGAPITILLEIE